mmetsp:Transcript_18666/g.46878  ORF Transcript_18666/g.46878 Transcript_18666/m.46878 type:complete len:374 (-) Transcript_18666:249-1370(-)|eukprot:CAMPEP_0115283994 /NCGR_PEP_ID=MMETSP0270-20121206/60665_1 /TAXON_ID=71861 /ORGANISM="Scrippsiella trochoidea, Strain CCMP3099" /LENGTH=373 /DNA_ID=CAMNT_0002700929 /DNA_START=67 /DNA_END=1188 /DNA_ORIENTATION=+
MWRLLTTLGKPTLRLAASGTVAAASAAAAAAPWKQQMVPAQTPPRHRERRGLRPKTGVVGAPVACEPALPTPGGAAEFGATYELLEELGRGSFGVVQRVRHVPTGELRAVKRLPAHSTTPALIEPQTVSMAEAKVAPPELEALASLDHPNVAGFVEYFNTGEEVLLVQELCEGGPLEALLEQANGRGLGAGKETARALKHMLQAVRHCHERGFVHRDLKADNFVFASRDRQDSELKLIDFGLAGRCSEGQRLQGRAGTVDYSAPEALAEGAGFGLPADMWALGAIFFLLITGEPLIKVHQPNANPCDELRSALQGEATRKVLDAKYVRLRVASASSRIPAAAADLLQELLRQDPALRITAEEALRHPFISANA